MKQQTASLRYNGIVEESIGCWTDLTYFDLVETQVCPPPVPPLSVAQNGSDLGKQRQTAGFHAKTRPCLRATGPYLSQVSR